MSKTSSPTTQGDEMFCPTKLALAALAFTFGNAHIAMAAPKQAAAAYECFTDDGYGRKRMVGSDPNKFAQLAEETRIPKGRQESCQGGFSNASWSWRPSRINKFDDSVDFLPTMNVNDQKLTGGEQQIGGGTA